MSNPVEEAKKSLKSLTAGLTTLGEMQKEYMKKLDPETRVKAIKFQEQYATLISKGDNLGAMRLSEQFKKDNA